MVELSLGMTMFVFLILVPGLLALWASGRPAESGLFREAVYRGVLVFAIAVIFSALVEGVSRAVGRSVPLASNLVGLLGGPDGFARTFAGWALALFCLAVASGFCDLFMDLRGVRSLKAQTRLRNFLLSGTSFEISARDDMLFYIFLYYRCAGKRPYVTVQVEGGGKTVEGEVLKFAWGPRGGMLLLDADDPRKTVWLPLARLSWVRFENTKWDQDRDVLPQWLQEWFEMLHPGLADEIKERLEKKGNKHNFGY